MITSRNYKFALYFVLFVTVTALFLLAASQRPFWIDENVGFEGLDASFLKILLEGVRGQCSRSPLFYLFNKALFPAGDPPDTTYFRVLLRAPTAVSAAFLLCLVVNTWKKFPLVGLLTAAYLFQEALFINHATEARPYILWLLMSYVFTVWFVRDFFEANPSNKHYLRFAALCIGLTLLATGSLFMICALLAWYLFFQRKNFLKMACYLAPSIAICFYYATMLTCENHASGSGIVYNVIFTVKNHDYTLIKAIIKLLIAPKDLPEVPINLGYAALAYLWYRNPSEYRKEGKKILSLVFIFTLAAIVTGIAVALKNYYFVSRLFIFILAARILIIGIVFTALYEKWLKNYGQKPALQYAAKLFFVVLILYALFRAFSVYPLTEISHVFR